MMRLVLPSMNNYLPLGMLGGDGAYITLKTVVEIHEAVHAVWHVGLDARGQAWTDPGAVSSVLHEIIAQYYTKMLCDLLADYNTDRRMWPQKTFNAILRNLPVSSEYRLHERLNEIDGESVRSFFLSFRGRNQGLTWDMLWNAVLEAIVMLHPFLSRYLSPADMSQLTNGRAR